MKKINLIIPQKIEIELSIALTYLKQKYKLYTTDRYCKIEYRLAENADLTCELWEIDPQLMNPSHRSILQEIVQNQIKEDPFTPASHYSQIFNHEEHFSYVTIDSPDYNSNMLLAVKMLTPRFYLLLNVGSYEPKHPYEALLEVARAWMGGIELVRVN